LKASTVYSVFSVRVYAPAAVAAHVSTSDAWMMSYRFDVRLTKLRPSSTAMRTRGCV